MTGTETAGRTGSGRFRVYDGVFDAWGVPGANPPLPRGDAATVVSSDRAPIADVLPALVQLV